jgi:hypothetical protein
MWPTRPPFFLKHEVTEMRGSKNAQQQARHLRDKAGVWYSEFLVSAAATDTGGVADSGSFLHDSGRGPTRKLEIPKLANHANNLAAQGVSGFNTAGFRQLALELKAMGAPLSDTGVA